MLRRWPGDAGEESLVCLHGDSHVEGNVLGERKELYESDRRKLECQLAEEEEDRCDPVELIAMQICGLLETGDASIGGGCFVDVLEEK